MARISVIVPAYDVEEYLADCLDSVLDQRVDLRFTERCLRAAFMAHAGAFLATAGPGVEDRLPAIQRLKWRLVREERLDDLLVLLDQPPTRLSGMDLLARRARQALTALRPAQLPLPASPDSYASTTAPTRSRTPSLDNKAAT